MIVLMGAALAHNCPESFIQAELPARDAADVPVDVAPVVMLGWCAESFKLELTAEGQPTMRMDAPGGLITRMVLETELQPDTLYTLTVAPEDDPDWVDQVQFTTADRMTTPLEDDPVVLGADLDAWGSHTVWLSGQIRVQRASDVEPVGLTVLLDGAGDPIQWVVGGDDEVLFVLDEQEFSGDSYCVRAAQDDLAGNRSFAEVVCYDVDINYLDEFMDDPDPDGGGGCSTVPLAGGWLVALVAVRRRRAPG